MCCGIKWFAQQLVSGPLIWLEKWYSKSADTVFHITALVHFPVCITLLLIESITTLTTGCCQVSGMGPHQPSVTAYHMFMSCTKSHDYEQLNHVYAQWILAFKSRLYSTLCLFSLFVYYLLVLMISATLCLTISCLSTFRFKITRLY